MLGQVLRSSSVLQRDPGIEWVVRRRLRGWWTVEKVVIDREGCRQSTTVLTENVAAAEHAALADALERGERASTSV